MKTKHEYIEQAIPLQTCHICGELDLCRYLFRVFDLARQTIKEYYLCTICASDFELRYDFDLHAYEEPPDIF